MAAMYFYTRLEMCHFQQGLLGGGPHRRLILKMTPFLYGFKKVNVLKQHQFKNHKRTSIKNILSSVKMAVLLLLFVCSLFFVYLFSQLCECTCSTMLNQGKTVLGYF